VATWKDAGQARDGAAARVLIVDDDAAVRLLCAVNLNAEGLQVLEAADGLDGFEQARCECPDLVLTDVMMPRLDGFQLAEKLRGDECTRRSPLIFLSGEDGQTNVERARALGALAYLTKPFDPRALAAFVAHELAAASARPSEVAATVAG
jgi:CheY-like chemotaxis protein